MLDQDTLQKYGFEKPFEPDPLVIQALPYLGYAQHVLDVGCGEGADSAFLAGLGYRVTAVDENESCLGRLRVYKHDKDLATLTIHGQNVLAYPYPANHFDLITCLLVGCCMRKSEFEHLTLLIRKAARPGGIVVMSLRNYLDPQMREYAEVTTAIEPNTYRDQEDCCKIRYYIEEGRLREVFHGYDILSYFEGMVPDKYREVPEHGDSCIICRKPESVILYDDNGAS